MFHLTNILCCLRRPEGHREYQADFFSFFFLLLLRKLCVSERATETVNIWNQSKWGENDHTPPLKLLCVREQFVWATMCNCGSLCECVFKFIMWRKSVIWEHNALKATGSHCCEDVSLCVWNCFFCILNSRQANSIAQTLHASLKISSTRGLPWLSLSYALASHAHIPWMFNFLWLVSSTF